LRQPRSRSTAGTVAGGDEALQTKDKINLIAVVFLLTVLNRKRYTFISGIKEPVTITKGKAARSSRLLTEERRRTIVGLLEKDGKVTVDDLVGRFGVSAVTVRSDLDILAEMGALKRSHGGAVCLLEPAHDYPLKVEETLHHNEKVRIGQAAVQYVQPNQTIMLDSGSTTAEVARQFKNTRIPGVTIITNSLHIAAELADLPDMTLIMIGGILRQISKSFVGPPAEQTIRDLHADHLFLGVDSLDVEIGPSTPDVLEAQLNGLMVRSCREVTIVADSSKFGRRSLSVIAPMDRVHRVITDVGIPAASAESLKRRGVHVVAV
jgi:DeoR/GlpR family transcriptional regulator of sugar metabolism